MKKLVLLSTVLLLILMAYSQDKIYRNNGKVVEAKIIEIGSDEIKYKEFQNPDGPTYILETDKIKKIVFENGVTQKFAADYKDPERYAGQLRKAVKINFLAPLYGYTEFGYEQSLGVGRAYELSLGIIGLGKSETIEYSDFNTGQLFSDKRGQAGVFISGGYKFGKLPDFIIFGKTKMTHLMQGTYAKPILYFGYYKENVITDKTGTESLETQHVTFGALQIELGHQWVFSDKFLLDLYWGFGYGVDNKKDDYYFNTDKSEEAFNYANARVGTSPGLSFTFGVKCGLLIK